MIPKSTDRSCYKQTHTDRVIPSIFDKLLDRKPWKVFIQHECAPAYVPANDKDVLASGYRVRTALELGAQPANSFDFNELDLEIFDGVQALQYKEATKTVEELVLAVYKS